METTPQAIEHWKQLYAHWHEAHQLARKARDDTTRALMAGAYGLGIPPSIEELDDVHQLERTADWLRVQMDAALLSLLPPDSRQRIQLS